MFELKFSTANDAFDDPREISRILRDVAKQVDRQSADLTLELGGAVYDINGNTVGRWSYR